MHHAILHACLPSLIALAVLSVALQVILRASGAKLCLARLRDVHRCEAGGVQSLAFVLTLPLFLAVVMFIVQVALVMVALITVNTAAFAAARSAAVWIPAYVSDIEPENRLLGATPGAQLPIDFGMAQSSLKCSKIFNAAALACVPIAPSRADGSASGLSVLSGTNTDEALVNLYSTIVPSSASNPVMPQRLRNKLAYSLQNTRVIVSFVDKNSLAGPTYNPQAHPLMINIPNEVGWQDPVTVEVQHHFRLLPGAGRFLARLLMRYDGRTDEVAPRIQEESGVYKTWLTGSATLTVEGLKSIRPYEQQQ